ncbi:MAG: RHS repeat-associated core domain-containing protein, partial [Chloroflexota bacterium]
IAQATYIRDASTERNDASRRSGSGLNFFYTDHLGSANTLVDQNGTQTNTRFMPFGEIRSGGDQLGSLTERGFTGHRENREIGLTYMNARFYIPGIGRFASPDVIIPDPMSPQTFNRFSYVTNNPIRLSDPSGRCGADMMPVNPNAQDALEGQAQRQDLVQNPQAYEACLEVRDRLIDTYGVRIIGAWKLYEIELLEATFSAIIDLFSESGIADPNTAFRSLWQGTKFTRVDNFFSPTASYGRARGSINITNFTFFNGNRNYKNSSGVMGTYAHEMMHIWDQKVKQQLSEELKEAVGGHGENCVRFVCSNDKLKNWSYDTRDNSPSPRSQITGKLQSSREDLAHTFEVLVTNPGVLYNPSLENTARYDYMIEQIQSLEK